MVGTGRSGAEEESHRCTWVLKTRKNRMRFCRGGGREQPRLDLSCVWGEKISKAHQILSAPAGETEHPDVKKDYLQKLLFLPVPEWQPSFQMTSLSQSRNVRRQNTYI